MTHIIFSRCLIYIYIYQSLKIAKYFFLFLPVDIDSAGPILDATISNGRHCTEMYSHFPHHGWYSFMHSLHLRSVYLRTSTNTSKVQIAKTALQNLLAGSKSLRLVYRWNNMQTTDVYQYQRKISPICFFFFSKKSFFLILCFLKT